MRDVYLSDSEVAEFKTVNEKRNALSSLVFVCENNPLVYNQSLYNKFIEDYRNVEEQYNNLWQAVSEKYGIEEVPGYIFNLEFSTKKVSLVPNTNEEVVV